MAPVADLDARTMRELHRPARSIPTSGRAAQAQASAIRTIERLQRERRHQEPPCVPRDWYPHDEESPFYRLDWVFVHAQLQALQRHSAAAWRERRA